MNNSKTINIRIKIFTHSNYFISDTLSWITVKIANSEDIQKFKSTKANFSKTWRVKRKKIKPLEEKN